MEKLCSLYVIGELSSSEKRELDAHLVDCAECRVMLHDYEQITFVDLAAIAAERTHESSSVDHPLQHPDRILARLLHHADAPSEGATYISERVADPSVAHSTRWCQWFNRSALWPSIGWVVACIAMVTAGYLTMQAKPAIMPVKSDLSTALEQVRSEARSWKLRAEQVEMQQQLSAHQLDSSIAQQAEAVANLQRLRTAYSESQQRQKLLEQQLAEESARLAGKESDLRATRASLDQLRQQVQLLNTSLQNATTNAAEARDRVAHFSQVSENTSARPAAPEPRVTDAEAREIFGARDLHIVDVYDVDRSGKTRRTYGRVYYVNRSLLLFYAFDLEDRKNKRKAAGFQAWGFREPNSSKAENLGLFYVDDASLNRWVLRVSDANVLARIDTVFVTLEPPQGSEYPRGPKLLFASLGGPANHP